MNMGRLLMSIFIWFCAIATTSPKHDDGIRIINGVNAPPGKYPSQVSVQVMGQHICGGSILNADTILTAAHCLAEDVRTKIVSIVTSTVDINLPGRSYLISKVIRHQDYDPSDLLVNDIALIKILGYFAMYNGEGAVQTSFRGQPIASNTWATAIGWGYTQPDSGVSSNLLKEVELQMLNYKDCSEIVGQIHSTQFCIVYPGYGKGICEGDSGGPVLAGGRQVGIISWRDGHGPCGGAPAVATLVSHYIEWLEKNV